MPEVDDLVQRFPAELATLKAAVIAKQTVAPVAKSKKRTRA